MLKVLNSQQLKALDQETILHEPISSLNLMERAASAFVQWFVQHYKANTKIGIVCGTGNNGGDGLVIARLLKAWSYPVAVWVIQGGKESEDFKTNLAKLDQRITVREIKEQTDIPSFESQHVLIDAIFGTGLTRPTEGLVARVIEAINHAKAIRIAVDLPSGLLLESHSTGSIVKADFTITFQSPKLAFFLPENFQFVGQWHYVEIGLDKKGLKDTEAVGFYITRQSIKEKLKKRSTFDHKGDNGKALIVAGSLGKMGACILAARAALRAGLGLLTVHVPAVGYSIIQTAVPEAMATIDENEGKITKIGNLEGYTAIGVGPGIGQSQETARELLNLLSGQIPLVIDADALNIIGSNKELIHSIKPGKILTPHVKEFERLVGAWKDDFHRLEKQKQLASTTKSVIILKGAYTSIASPEGIVFFNSTGNPGMATGGSGDVLTGILTSLLAQGYSSLDTALIGVFLHGLAGDIAAREKGMDSLIASDLIEFLPQAFLKVRS